MQVPSGTMTYLQTPWPVGTFESTLLESMIFPRDISTCDSCKGFTSQSSTGRQAEACLQQGWAGGFGGKSGDFLKRRVKFGGRISQNSVWNHFKSTNQHESGQGHWEKHQIPLAVLSPFWARGWNNDGFLARLIPAVFPYNQDLGWFNGAQIIPHLTNGKLMDLTVDLDFLWSKSRHKKATGRWWFQICFFIFSRIPGDMIQFDLSIFFTWEETIK